MSDVSSARLSPQSATFLADYRELTAELSQRIPSLNQVPLTPLDFPALPLLFPQLLAPLFSLLPQTEVIPSSGDLALWQHFLQQDNDQPRV